MTTLSVDVAIVGGGMAGLTLGIALTQAGIATAVIDHEDPQQQQERGYDGRSSAIAHVARLVFEATGIWPHLVADAQPIEDIRVSDGSSRLFLHYDHHDLDDEDGPAPPFGYIIENRCTRAALHARAREVDGLIWLAPAELELARLHGAAGAIDRDAGGVRLTLADGRRVAAQLVVGADGARSRVREHAGIARTGWSYGQSGIVCTVAHERPHEAVAHERFLAPGPFAMLPMTPTAEAPHRSSLVWTDRNAVVPAILRLDDAGFGRAMEDRFGPQLGRLRPISPRSAFPLELRLAHRFVDHRLALIGDAAHRMHPIAGQGLNVGLRDVAALAEVIVEARRSGLDVGAPEVLARYQRWRRFDTALMLGVTDGINRLFSNDVLPLRLIRDLGLAAVDRMGPLKRVFMRHAMGVVGDRPKLARGIAL